MSLSFYILVVIAIVGLLMLHSINESGCEKLVSFSPSFMVTSYSMLNGWVQSIVW
jgi:hypothetical protein